MQTVTLTPSLPNFQVWASSSVHYQGIVPVFFQVMVFKFGGAV